jgi:hypothetical protein
MAKEGGIGGGRRRRAVWSQRLPGTASTNHSVTHERGAERKRRGSSSDGSRQRTGNNDGGLLKLQLRWYCSRTHSGSSSASCAGKGTFPVAKDFRYLNR